VWFFFLVDRKFIDSKNNKGKHEVGHKNSLKDLYVYDEHTNNKII